MTMLMYAAAFLTGFLAALGVGGGMVLIIWLTAVMGMSQLEAQGINLIFFLPIAFLSVLIHRKNGLIDLRLLMPAIFSGAAFACAGALLAHIIGSELLGKIFSVFLLIIGLRELFSGRDGSSSAL